MVETWPAEGAADVDRRPIVRVRFDRPILPRSIDESTVQLVSGLRSVALVARADPLLPGIVITPARALEPDVAWRLSIEGVRDLDGELVTAHEIRFRTGSVASPLPTIETPTWSEIGPLLAARCGGCHGGPAPLLGLDLSSSAGVRATAIGVASRELPAAPSPAAATIGGLGGMPRIAAYGSSGSPETSYLVYKLLGDRHLYGDRMPPPDDAGPGGLDPGSIERIALWIAGGAPTE